MNLDAFKEHWGVVAKIAAWLTGVIGTFLITPPLLSLDRGDSNMLYFAQFVLAIVVGLFFIVPSSRVRGPQWRLISIVALVAGIGLFFAYVLFFARWTAMYEGVGRMVIGETLSEVGKQIQTEFHTTSPGRTIWLVNGEVEALWPQGERLTRYLALCGMYTAAMIALSVSAMSMIEFVRIRQASSRVQEADSEAS